MSDNQSARQDDIEIDMEAVDDDADDSIVADRQARAPSLVRLGRYRLVREIASGGMATVNLAVADGLDKLVALKIIHPHLAQEDTFVQMFLDEARLASAISHRNVCNVFDFGETDGRFYIAMDYLSGQSLRDVLRRLRKADLKMEPRRLAVYVAYMLAEACEGLHAAHELHGSDGEPLNVVHRDVSPHNLFVTYDGNVSVVDFGIARASDRIQSTATGVLKGKFSYMAPEQMRQLAVDRRADVWALGVVLWESLLLKRLFVRSSQADTVMSVMMDKVKPPSEINPDLPKELDTIVLRALARSPAQRFATAREMGRELMRFCRESGVMVSPIEIEGLLERLFESEIAENKALMRKAKQSGGESGVWVDVTPSGFARVPMRSGMVQRGQYGSSPPADMQENAPRSIVITQNSQVAPTAEALGTAHPKKRKRLLWIGAIAACAVLGGLAVMPRGPSAEPMATVTPDHIEQVEAPNTSAGAAGSAATTGMVAATPASDEAAEEQPSVDMEEPAVIMPEEEKRKPGAGARTGAAPRPEPRRVEPRPAQRAPVRPASPPQATKKEQQPEQTAAARTGEEPGPRSGEQAASDEEEGANVAPQAPQQPSLATPPAPAVVAAKPVESAPVKAAQPVAPSTPVIPQKLDARASIAALEVEGALGSSIVQRMLARAVPLLKECYVQAAKRAGRNDFTSLPVSLVIDEVGTVRNVQVGSHALGDLSSCAEGALKRMRSPRVPDVGTEQVKFKVAFTP